MRMRSLREYWELRWDVEFIYGARESDVNGVLGMFRWAIPKANLVVVRNCTVLE